MHYLNVLDKRNIFLVKNSAHFFFAASWQVEYADYSGGASNVFALFFHVHYPHYIAQKCVSALFCTKKIVR